MGWLTRVHKVRCWETNDPGMQLAHQPGQPHPPHLPDVAPPPPTPQHNEAYCSDLVMGCRLSMAYSSGGNICQAFHKQESKHSLIIAIGNTNNQRDVFPDTSLMGMDS